MKDKPSILKTIQLGAHTVPGIWRYMLPEDVLYFRVDPERGSTCFDCPQVKAHGFHPVARCCSYIPRIPNFLLGFALMDPETESVARTFVGSGFTIPEGSQVAPLQLEQSLGFLSGQLPHGTVICPLLDRSSKRCMVYAHRNAVCSTFFCRHDQGEVGAEFWESLTDLATQVETALAQWALAEVGFDLDAYFLRFESLAHNLESCIDPGTGTWSETARQTLFGAFYEREEQLFLATAEVVIQNKEKLFAIASAQKLRQTPAYDAAQRQRLAPRFPESLLGEALPDGEAVPIQSLWYSTQLAHRNLQLHRLKDSPT